MLRRIVTLACVSFVAGGFALHAAEPAASQPKQPKWAGHLDLGALQTQGNTAKLSATLTAGLTRKVPKHEIDLSANATYGESQDVKDTNKGGLKGRFSWLFTPEFFAFTEGVGEYDEFQSLDLRTRAALGVGWKLLAIPTTELSVRLGGGWVSETYEDPLPDDSFAAVTFGLDFLQRIGEHLVFTQKLDTETSAEDNEDWLLTSETELRSRLSEQISLSLVALNKYDNNPPGDLEENDLTLTTTLGFNF
ncbi:MAG: DUF481 domain-containing protein [Kiritimatiellae bacterium]|nr:DUF481 domain-containing protein [Kiritimatiellia bacterium]